MKRDIPLALGLAAFSLSVLAQSPEMPLYLDPAQPADVRAKDLISHLTLEEKAIFLNHVGPDIERLNIKSDKWNQCLHGVVWEKPTTMFPVSIAAVATWDPVLIHAEATAISDEARAIYNSWHTDRDFTGTQKGLIYRAPVINISRNPYWGRINECYGEDPFLTGRIGVAFVKGLQGDDPKYLKLASTLKHYAVNNVERDRQSLNAVVSERMLHEYWLPHFKDCIMEGQAQSVMASYNAINGVHNNMNKLLLTDILKNQWGFQGFVVSDLGGVNTMMKSQKMTAKDAVAQSMVAGCDFSDKEFMDNIPAAVKDGSLPIERLDDAVFRVMRDRIRLGEFDSPERVPWSKLKIDILDNPQHRALTLKVAHESIVLLANRDSILPLDRSKIKTLAVLGPHADLFTPGGYSGKANNPVKPLVGLKNRAGNGIEILTAPGARFNLTNASPEERDVEVKEAVEVAKKVDVVVLFVGTTLNNEAEGRDRTTLALPGNQQDLADAVIAANPKTIVVEMNAGPLAVQTIADKAATLVEAWWAGEEGGNAIADVIFGDYNPGGKMPLTVYASDKQVPPQDQYDITQGFTYMYLKEKPLFAFGHGLSYSTFEYSNLTLSSKTVAPTGTITVSFEIKNTGKLEGDEVAQLYIHEVSPAITRPLKELRGFQRVHLSPGESQKVTLTLPAEKLAYYNETLHAFTVNPGDFEILVGGASDDIRLKDKLAVP